MGIFRVIGYRVVLARAYKPLVKAKLGVYNGDLPPLWDRLEISSPLIHTIPSNTIQLTSIPAKPCTLSLCSEAPVTLLYRGARTNPKRLPPANLVNDDLTPAVHYRLAVLLAPARPV